MQSGRPEQGRGREERLPHCSPIGQLSGFYTGQTANHSHRWKNNTRWCLGGGKKKKEKNSKLVGGEVGSEKSGKDEGRCVSSSEPGLKFTPDNSGSLLDRLAAIFETLSSLAVFLPNMTAQVLPQEIN